MHIIWSLIVGLVVGAIAKLLMPGKDPGGILLTALLGIGGAMLAAFLGRSLGFYRADDMGPGIIASIIGADAHPRDLSIGHRAAALDRVARSLWTSDQKRRSCWRRCSRAQPSDVRTTEPPPLAKEPSS